MGILAIDIGGTKFSIAAFDGNRMLRRETRQTNREGGRDWMLEQIFLTGEAWRQEMPLERCGIGFGGPVDFTAQRIALSTHVGGWSDTPLTELVAQRLGIPTIMDNDGNAGAFGEFAYGAGQGADPLLYVTISTGIGGGIVTGGRTFRGADSYAGEIGHLTVRPDGPECLCGARGCLERMCCGLWLERDYGRPAEQLLRDREFVSRYVVDLALGIKAAIMLLNPSRVVIGGGIAKAGEALFAPLRAELRRIITPWSRARIEVAPAALGDDSVLYGALALANEI